MLITQVFTVNSAVVLDRYSISHQTPGQIVTMAYFTNPALRLAVFSLIDPWSSPYRRYTGSFSILKPTKTPLMAHYLSLPTQQTCDPKAQHGKLPAQFLRNSYEHLQNRLAGR